MLERNGDQQSGVNETADADTDDVIQLNDNKFLHPLGFIDGNKEGEHCRRMDCQIQ